MATIDMLVLASSRKGGGRCLAGWDLEGERWIRPVSGVADGTLYQAHCAVAGDWPEVFDIVRIELAAARPQPWQPENWVIADAPWERVGRAEPAEVRGGLADLVDHDIRMLESADRTIAAEELRQEPIDASLVLVRPDQLRWRIETPRWGRQRKAYFELDGFGPYDLQVTDPPIEAHLGPLADGIHEGSAAGLDDGDEVLLTLSLAERTNAMTVATRLLPP